MAKLKIKRGDNERLQALVTPSSAVSTGIYFMAKRSLLDADNLAVISKSIASGGITIADAGTDGDPNSLPPILPVPAKLLIQIDTAETQVLPNNRTTVLVYELEDGAGHTLDSGQLVVLPEIRQA